MDVSEFQALIADYEVLVNELTHELHNVKSEHDELKTKIPSVVSENQQLLEELKQFVTYKKTRDSQTDNELIQNLKKQIHLVVYEKEQLTQLWRTATKSVEILENELDIYRGGSVELFPKHEYIRATEAYEQNITTLESRLQVLQSQLESKNLEIKNLAQVTLTHTQSAKDSESKITMLNKKICDLEESCEHLKKKSRDKEKTIQKMMDQNNEFKEKIVEAIEVVQAALNEKDASLAREAKVKAEIQKINEDLDSIIKGIEEKCCRDILLVREEAERRSTGLWESYQNLQEELKTKLVEIEKHQAKNIILQNEIDKFAAGGVLADGSSTSKLLILEKNLESTFQKLLVSEKQNIQFKADLDAIKNDMEQMSAHYERILKAKEVERLSLQNTINQLQSFVDEKDLTIRSVNNELANQQIQKDNLEKGYKLHVENQEKMISDIKSEKNELTTCLSDQIKELHSELGFKDNVNKKVLAETKEIVSKLENLAKNLKLDIRKFKTENRILKNQLDAYRKALFHYKEILAMLATDVNNTNIIYSINHHQRPNILS